MELPLLPIVAQVKDCCFATRKPFAGGLHRSRSVGLTAFAVGKSFSSFPKWLKSQAAQVSAFEFVLIGEIRVKNLGGFALKKFRVVCVFRG
jgi:hypothetical protein